MKKKIILAGVKPEHVRDTLKRIHSESENENGEGWRNILEEIAPGSYCDEGGWQVCIDANGNEIDVRRPEYRDKDNGFEFRIFGVDTGADISFLDHGVKIDAHWEGNQIFVIGESSGSPINDLYLERLWQGLEETYLKPDKIEKARIPGKRERPDTEEKLKKLRRLREADKRTGRISSRGLLCTLAGIHTATVKRNAPELYNRFYDMDY